MIQAKTRDEALEWARRIPAADSDSIGVRKVFHNAVYAGDAQAAADNDTERVVATK